MLFQTFFNTTLVSFKIALVVKLFVNFIPVDFIFVMTACRFNSKKIMSVQP